MEITTTVAPADRAGWRAWLAAHAATATEVWLLTDREAPALSYLDAVEEALCVGWIDGIGKRAPDGRSAQRFTPRAKRSRWTELNKARARRLIALGLMTDAGRAVLPPLDEPPPMPPDIEAALRAEPGAWSFFAACPELYRRVRVGYVEDGRRDAAEFDKRLRNLVAQSAAGRMFGNWNDDGRLTGPAGA